MFSKKKMMIVGVVLLVVANIIILSITSRRQYSLHTPGPILIGIIAPFQDGVAKSMNYIGDLWRHYFDLASAARENDALKKTLARNIQENKRQRELLLANQRLRTLLGFSRRIPGKALAAEVIGRDPSHWFKSVTIDKGREDGIRKGMPVVVAQGIAGQVAEVSGRYARVLLAIDRNSAVDALVQRSRSRGIIKGDATDQYRFQYVLRKDDVQIGDAVVSSGLDGVFPKGLRIGRVADITRKNSGIFQQVTVIPYVDFEKLEEVLVILGPPPTDTPDAR